MTIFPPWHDIMICQEPYDPVQPVSMLADKHKSLLLDIEAIPVLVQGSRTLDSSREACLAAAWLLADEAP